MSGEDHYAVARGKFFSLIPSCGGTMKVPWDLQQSGGKDCSLVTGAKGYCGRMCSNLLSCSEKTYLTSIFDTRKLMPDIF